MARLRVKKAFVDKFDHKVLYKPGQVITIDDPEREKDLISRGLCAAVKVKTPDKKEDNTSVQDPAGEAEVPGVSEEETDSRSEE